MSDERELAIRVELDRPEPVAPELAAACDARFEDVARDGCVSDVEPTQPAMQDPAEFDPAVGPVPRR
jgi:hypothetical protein